MHTQIKVKAFSANKHVYVGKYKALYVKSIAFYIKKRFVFINIPKYRFRYFIYHVV